MQELAINETIEDVSATTREYIRDHYAWHAVFLVFLLTIWDTLAFLMLALDDFRLYLYPWTFLFVGYLWVKEKVQRVFMQQFAAVNGFTYKPHGAIVESDALLFRQGRKRKIYNVVLGVWGKYPLRIFRVMYRNCHLKLHFFVMR